MKLFEKPVLIKLTVIVAIAVLSLGSYLLFGNSSSSQVDLFDNAEIKEEFIVSVVDVYELKPLISTVDSEHRTFARAKINGTIASISVTEGDDVEQGEVLAIIIDPKIAPEISAIDLRIQGLKEQRDLAMQEYNRNKALVESNIISKSKFDEISTNFKVLEKNLSALESDRQAILEKQSEGRVSAPLSGKVLSIPMTKGMLVLTGENLIEIGGGNLILRLGLPETHENFIKINDEILIQDQNKVDSAKHSGVVSKIFPKLESGQIIAEIKIKNLDDMYIGKLLNAYIKTKSHLGIIVPQRFITSKHGLKYANLKNLGEVVIQTGDENEKGVEVLSGLKSGDILLVYE